MQAGDRLIAPDFVVRCRRTDRSVAVEVVGYWTPSYLENKVAALAAIRETTPWLLCVEDPLALAEDQLPAWPILRYRRKIDAKALARLVDEAQRG